MRPSQAGRKGKGGGKGGREEGDTAAREGSRGLYCVGMQRGQS